MSASEAKGEGIGGEIQRDNEHEEIRIAMIGNVDSGKSTLIGVLCGGKLDDGRGLARSAVFSHKHEAATGRTSAISHQLIGYRDIKSPGEIASGAGKAPTAGGGTSAGAAGPDGPRDARRERR